MEAIRIIDLFHFSRASGWFIDSAFKNSSRRPTEPETPDGLGGISVIDITCACPDRAGACICRYIAQHYGQLVDDPFAYWVFDTALLDHPDPATKKPELVHAPIPGGDQCHWNIYCVDDKRARKIRKTIPLEDVRLCINGQCEPFTIQRAKELQELRESIALDADD